MSDHGHRVEDLFARLFADTFLKSFVYHSPKYHDPTEAEAGDVIVWCRRFLVAFEVVSRNPIAGDTTKRFIRRIGEKCRQLERDRTLYCEPHPKIEMVNAFGKSVPFDKSKILPIKFLGVVLVAAKEDLEKLHFESVRKAVDSDFPIAIMRTHDLGALLDEVDTIPDLVYYLNDRAHFLEQVYEQSPQPFLDLNRRADSELLAFYKLHENSFPADQWGTGEMKSYPAQYRERWGAEKSKRDAENESTAVIDQIIEFIVGINPEYPGSLFHAWELGQLSRRERAMGLSERIVQAFTNIHTREDTRYFAWFSQSTGCWSVFCFGRGSREAFVDEVKHLCYLKLILEIEENQFEHAVFGFGFFKSPIETGTSFDFITLEIADADDHSNPAEGDLGDARSKFNANAKPIRVAEFPRLNDE